jgi:hypothetical protein
MEAHTLRVSIPEARFQPLPSGLKRRLAPTSGFKVRYAAASQQQILLRALGFENGGWHTRLEAVFALYFRFLDAFFASQKTGLSAPIPRPACGSPTGFPEANPQSGDAANPLRGALPVNFESMSL